jgi:predicted nucleotidyltransferase
VNSNLIPIMSVSGIIDRVVGKIQEIPGVEAVVLGGSRARGTHTDSSDVDLGIYYHPTVPLDLVKLDAIAVELDDRHKKDLITQPEGWGPWINGGGWLDDTGPGSGPDLSGSLQGNAGYPGSVGWTL